MATTDVTGARWRKSSHSGGANNCVEVARSWTRAAVRDTKNRTAGILAFDGPAFSGFLAAVKADRLGR